jgi:hypothetical protein
MASPNLRSAAETVTSAPASTPAICSKYYIHEESELLFGTQLVLQIKSEAEVNFAAP